MKNSCDAPTIQVKQGLIAGLMLLAALTTPCLAEPSRFLPLNFPGATAISDDGRTVTGRSLWTPYIWTEAGGQQVIPLPADHQLFDVTDISGDGSTVVGGVMVSEGYNRRYESFRWTQAGGLQLLGRMPGDDYRWAYATGASYDGSVIVGVDETNNGRRAYRWTEATGQVDFGTLGTLNPFYPPSSAAFGVSADGSIVIGGVTTIHDDSSKAFRWSNGNFDMVLAPGWSGTGWGYNTTAMQLSGDGKVMTGYYQPGDLRQWVWNAEAGFTVLQSPGVQTSVAITALSHDGSTLVGHQRFWDTTPPYDDERTEAVIWRKTNSGYDFFNVAQLLLDLNVDLKGWRLTAVKDASADGRTLVGSGISPDGVERSWVAVLAAPVPEPASATTALAGLIAFAGVARRSAAVRRM